jgi:hypothetical protein
VSLTHYASDMLGRALCARAPLLPTTVYAALGTGGNPVDGLIGEPVSCPGYARQLVVFTGSGELRSEGPLQFIFNAAAGTLTHAGLFDAATGGNALMWVELMQPALVSGSGTVTIAGRAFSVSVEGAA